MPGVVAMPGVAPAADSARPRRRRRARRRSLPREAEGLRDEGRATPDKEKKSAKGANKRSVTPEGASAGDDDNDDSEDEELDTTGKTTDEIRRQRRMLSNRESARRSRRRKLEHVAVLEGQINGHRRRTRRRRAPARGRARAESAIRENAGLKAEVRPPPLREAGGKGGAELVAAAHRQRGELARTIPPWGRRRLASTRTRPGGPSRSGPCSRTRTSSASRRRRGGEEDGDHGDGLLAADGKDGYRRTRRRRRRRMIFLLRDEPPERGVATIACTPQTRAVVAATTARR